MLLLYSILPISLCICMILCQPIVDTDGNVKPEDIINLIPKSGIGGNTGGTDALVAKKTSEQIQSRFKGDMKVENLQEGSDSAVKCPKDLDCDFGRACQWRNVGDDSSVVTSLAMKGTGKPDPKGDFYTYTDSAGEDPPRSPYGLMVGRKGESRNDVWLVSAPIKKQPGDGYVTLRQWSTFKSEIEVCTRKSGSKSLNCRLSNDICSKTDRGKRPLTMYKISGPIDDPFEIVIKGAVDKALGGVNLFDDVKYRSALCDDDEAVCGDEDFGEGGGGDSGSSSKTNRGRCQEDSKLCVKLDKKVCENSSAFTTTHCQNFCGLC